ncbi:MAG: hypothetical protein ACYC6A_03295 [Armatimonadota bacterium]
MQLTPHIFEDVRSPFIADRLRETGWQHRRYILDLLQLACFIERNGPRSYAEAIGYSRLKHAYPVEHRALDLEYREGRHVSTGTFQQMKDEDHRRRAEAAAQQLRKARQAGMDEQRMAAQAFTNWRKAGGQP